MDSAKAAVKDFMSKSGHHDTTVHEKVAPAVTHETINKTKHEDVQTAIDKEVHQDHYHTSVQPVEDRAVLPEQHHHNIIPVEHRSFEHDNADSVKARLAEEQARFRDQQERVEGQHTSSVAPVVAGEHIHHHVHETIQPVVNKQTIEPHVVHTTVPIHEVHHNAAQHHSTSALPAVSMADFKKQGGVLSGREERNNFIQFRIHPVPAADVEAAEAQPPSAPLMPRGSSRSDKGNPTNQSQQQQQQPQRRQKRSRGRCCCRCLCWTVFTLVLLLLAIAVSLGILFLVFRPKLPKYSIDGLRITRFDLGSNMSLAATFNVNVTARNPNKRIGIYYEGGSELSAWYAGAKLCQGAFPKFYQGHRNTTLIDVALTGQTQNATGILTALDQQRRTGSIPLNLKAKVPVRIKLGKLKLMKLKFWVRCRLVVNSLAASNTIRIRSSSCKFRFKP